MPRGRRPRGITPHQFRVLEAVGDLMQEHRGIPPSLREIGDKVQTASQSTIILHLRRLREAGLIEYEPWIPRSNVPTQAGWELLGTVLCSGCGGCGRVPA